MTILADRAKNRIIWLVDSPGRPLAESEGLFSEWGGCLYFPPDRRPLESDPPPDVVVASAEIEGGAGGGVFEELLDAADGAPAIVVSRIRSLAQAVDFFRAGASDYLTLPLDREEAARRLRAALTSPRLPRDPAEVAVTVEVEPLTGDPGEIVLALRGVSALPGDFDPNSDILAELPPEPAGPGRDSGAPGNPDGVPARAGGHRDFESLPCGILLLDRDGRLESANRPALRLFGHDAEDALRKAWEKPASFGAAGVNGKKIPDNQWPHAVAGRTKTPRAASLSIERPDRRRVWLHFSCQPHVEDGKLSGLTVAMVNVTEELAFFRKTEP